MYRLAGTVFDRDNPILGGELHYFACITPNQADIAVKMLNNLNAQAQDQVLISRELASWMLSFAREQIEETPYVGEFENWARKEKELAQALNHSKENKK